MIGSDFLGKTTFLWRGQSGRRRKLARMQTGNQIDRQMLQLFSNELQNAFQSSVRTVLQRQRKRVKFSKTSKIFSVKG